MAHRMDVSARQQSRFTLRDRAQGSHGTPAPREDVAVHAHPPAGSDRAIRRPEATVLERLSKVTPIADLMTQPWTRASRKKSA